MYTTTSWRAAFGVRNKQLKKKRDIEIQLNSSHLY